MVALPEPTDTGVVAGFARRIEDVIRWAKGTYPTARDSRKASLTPAAASLWKSLYPDLKRPHPAGDLVAAATERRAPICLRIALIHAIMEKSLMITPDHIRVGSAWAQYGADTAAYVLAGMGGQGRDTDRERKVLAFLGKQTGGEADRWAITRRCFGNRVSGADLDRVLAPLVDDGDITRREDEPKAGGRKRTIYSLTGAKFAKNAKNEQIQGFAGIEECAKYGEVCPGDFQTSQTSRKLRTPETPAVIDSSQTSQTSQTSQPSIEKCPQCHGAGCPACWEIPDDELVSGEI